MFVPSDKSRNIYIMDKDEYKKLLTKNLMKTYKKTNKDKLSKISSDTKKIYKKFSIDDRIERMQECESYITQFERNYSHFLLMAAKN